MPRARPQRQPVSSCGVESRSNFRLERPNDEYRIKCNFIFQSRRRLIQRSIKEEVVAEEASLVPGDNGPPAD